MIKKYILSNTIITYQSMGRNNIFKYLITAFIKNSIGEVLFNKPSQPQTGAKRIITSFANKWLMFISSIRSQIWDTGVALLLDNYVVDYELSFLCCKPKIIPKEFLPADLHVLKFTLQVLCIPGWVKKQLWYLLLLLWLLNQEY